MEELGFHLKDTRGKVTLSNTLKKNYHGCMEKIKQKRVRLEDRLSGKTLAIIHVEGKVAERSR